MKTLIAIPCMDTVPVQFAETMLNLDKPEGTRVCFHPGSLVYDSRNLLSLKAIEDGYDAVLWLDSDMVVPHDTLTRLAQDMDEQKVPMVTGLYFKRKLPSAPVIYKTLEEPRPRGDGTLERRLEEYHDYPQESVFPVAGCGFGCVMMRTSLIKDVWDHFGPAFAPYPWGGEDISFCYRVKQLGHRIFCDSTISCGHIGMIQYTEMLYRMTTGGEKH